MHVVGGRPGDAERPQESGVSDARPRWQDVSTAQSAAVLGLLRGEDLETVSRELGVMAATLTNWLSPTSDFRIPVGHEKARSRFGFGRVV